MERRRTACSLTPEGRILLEASRQIIATYRRLDEQLRSSRDLLQGSLRVASIFSIGLHELPPRLKAFREQFPGVTVDVSYLRSPEIYRLVASDEVELGLVAYPHGRPGMKFEVFDEDELVIICHPHHPLAARKSVPLVALNGEKFIAFKPDTPTRKIIDRRLREERVELQLTIEFDNVEMVKRAVAIESGISLVPSNTVTSEISSGTLVAIPVEGERFVRPLGVICKAVRSRSGICRAFIDALRAGAPQIPPTPSRAEPAELAV